MDKEKIKLALTRNSMEAWRGFLRGGLMTIGSIAVLALSLYVIILSYVFIKGTSGALEAVESRVTMSLYFKVGTEENLIESAKETMVKYPEVASVEYISAEKALEIFRDEYANEPSTLESLNEIGDTNPLPASLIITAKDSSQYQAILEKLSGESFYSEVERNNYEKRKEAIDKLYQWLKTLSRIGWTVGLLFAIVSILIIFNSIHIAIFSQASEIEVMKLVGAPNSFIRLPFILEGLMFGVGGGIIAFLVFLMTIPIINAFLHVATSQSLMAVGQISFLGIFGLGLILGAVLGVASALIAVARYLKA